MSKHFDLVFHGFELECVFPNMMKLKEHYVILGKKKSQYQKVTIYNIKKVIISYTFWYISIQTSSSRGK